MLRRLLLGRKVFRATFESEAGRQVLAHMRHFCVSQMNQSAFDPNPFGMARMVGRQEAYREMARFLALTDEQIDAAAQRARREGEEPNGD